VYLVARYQYPDLYLSEINARLEELRKDAWLELHGNLTALEKIRVLNHVIFAMHRFGRNTSNFYSPGNSFINQVLETRKGNPISIAVIYTLVAQLLELPVYGVNLPLNYILAYTDPDYADDPNGVLFYINPYNRGNVLSRQDIQRFLAQQNLPEHTDFFVPCGNIKTVSRILRNLAFAYEKIGYTDKLQQVTELQSLFKDREDQSL
jgi:regulator of sirC expression with transglutaminase-like and TPR domain